MHSSKKFRAGPEDIGQLTASATAALDLFDFFYSARIVFHKHVIHMAAANMHAWQRPRDSPRGRSFFRTYSPIRTRRRGYPRSLLLRLLAVATVVTICLVALRRDIVRIYYLPVRWEPTDFAGAAAPAELPLPAAPIRTLGGGDLGHDFDDRYVYLAELAKGGEGTTRLYEDRVTARTVVIKSWDRQRSNALPAELRPAFDGVAEEWPTEIQATLLFAGLESRNGTETGHGTASGFLPVVDYFLARSTGWRGVPSHTWRMVTPYVDGGTLEHLARRLRREQAFTAEELDLRFRRLFEDMLVALDSLHSRSFCHDDLKGPNIFVVAPRDNSTGGDDISWVLADLAHVRQQQHPYHDTAGWTIRRQWRDCRTNDVRHLVNTYLLFLRGASADRSRFNVDFSMGAQPWTRLYWDFMRDPTGATGMMERSASTRSKPKPKLEPGPEPASVDDGSGADAARPSALSSYRLRRLANTVTRQLAC